MPLETTKFTVQDYLKTPEDRAAYFDAVLEYDDPSYLAQAIGEIAKAHGVSAFAEEAGLSREVIYKSFRPGGNPSLNSLAKATRALGLRLSVVPT